MSKIVTLREGTSEFELKERQFKMFPTREMKKTLHEMVQKSLKVVQKYQRHPNHIKVPPHKTQHPTQVRKQRFVGWLKYMG